MKRGIVMANSKVPQLSKEERKAALEKAKVARRERAEIKRKLETKEMSISDVLVLDSPAVLRMSVYDLIKTQGGVGDRKTYKIMEELGIAYSRRIKGLGRIQREKLIRYFG